MNRIKLILLMTALMPMMAFPNSDDWLWEKEAEPIKIDSSRTVLVCTPGEGCKLLIINGN